MTPELEKEKILVSEILKTSFSLWKENFMTIALVIVIVYIPVQVLIELVSIIFEQMRGPNNLENIEDWRRLNNENRIYDSIRQIIGVIATLGIFNYIYSILRNDKNDENDESAYEIVKCGLKKWPENFGETLIAGFIILFYTLLLIIPGIYKAVQFSFISNLVSDEESEPREKSKLLVKDNWFSVLWILILTFLIGFVIELTVAIPFMLLPDNFLLTILLGIIAAIASSYTIVIRGVYYFNLKRLKIDTINETINPIIE
jgi:hypothetical protein